MESFTDLSKRIPELMEVLKNDKALSDMLLDMINKKRL